MFRAIPFVMCFVSSIIRFPGDVGDPGFEEGCLGEGGFGDEGLGEVAFGGSSPAFVSFHLLPTPDGETDPPAKL